MNDAGLRDVPLESGAIILTGGRDVTGNLLLHIPTTKLPEIEEWSTVNLATLFLRLVNISKYVKTVTGGGSRQGAQAQHATAVVCVADLRQASAQAIHQLVESLELVEHQHRGTIAAVYFIKPKSNSKSHILKKLLGIKPSKKRPRVPLFKIVLMKTVQDLYTQVDVCHLTMDVCGTLKYSHHAWMHLYDVVVQCIEEGKDIMSKLPSIKDKVDLLQEYEPDNQSTIQLQQLLADLVEKFQIIITESSLPACLTRSKQTLFQLDNASSNSLFPSLHPQLLCGMHTYLRDQYVEMDQWNTNLEEAWRVTESRFTLLIQINRHKERAKEIERKICDHYHPLLREHPIVGRTLSQAELYRAHFTTTLYEPAKELLSQANEILEAVHKLKTTVSNISAEAGALGGGGALLESINNTDFADISKCLTISIQPFTNHMQQLQQLYVGIHIFHLLFEKALSWYKKVLKFLPEPVLAKCLQDAAVSGPSVSPNTSGQEESSNTPQSGLVFMPPEWLGAIRVFLDRHPPPRQEHIDRLDMSPPYLVDRKLRAQARSLALRLRLLQRLMSNTRLPMKLVAAIINWKIELFGSSHSGDKSLPRSPATSPLKERPRGFSSGHRVASNTGILPTQHKLSSNMRKENPQFDSPDFRGHQKHTAKAETLPSAFMKKSHGEPLSSPDLVEEKRESIATKIQMKRVTTKPLPRAKSVEFSFNSSSTDGSVFDYEKAVSQAKKASEMPLRKDGKIPHTRLAQRKNKWMSSDLKTMPWVNAAEGFADQVLSDPSENHPFVRGASNQVSLGFKQHATDDDDLQNHSVLQEQFSNNSRISFRKSDPYPLNPKGPMDVPTISFKGDLDVNQDGFDDMSSSDERFIGLSSFDDHLQMHSKASMHYRSVDNLLSTTYNNQDEEETESGIDTMENGRLDPYDTVVKKIRAISASELPNFEKLKRVSSLIANSSIANNRNQIKDRKIHSKLSFSTLDLRPIDESENISQFNRDQNVFLATTQPILETGEKPVNAVLRMKENLAKSMEELNTYTSNSTTKAPSSSSPAKSYNSIPPKPTRRRYISKLTITPKYMNQGLTLSSTDEAKSERENEALQLEDLPPSSFNIPISKPRKENERFDHNSDSKLDTQNTINMRQRLNSYDEDGFIVERKYQTNSLDEIVQGNNLENDNKQSIKSPPQRPTSLILSPSRNFISSSFMRPSHTNSSIDRRYSGSEVDPRIHSTHYRKMDHVIEDQSDKTPTQLSNRHSSLPSSMQHNKHQSHSSKTLDNSNTSKADNIKTFTVQQNDFSDSVALSQVLTAAESFEGTSVDPKQRNFSESRSWSRDSTSSFRRDLSSPDLEMRWMDYSAADVERLSNEAEIEMSHQDEVANSLMKTQLILEEEENRRSREDLYAINDGDDEGENIMRDNQDFDLNHSDAVDNGYGSWASKLISQPSTSSEGVEPDAVPTFGTFQIHAGRYNPNGGTAISRRRNFAIASENTSSSEKAHETMWLDSPTGELPKFE